MTDQHSPPGWVVVLEVAPAHDPGSIEPAWLKPVLEALADLEPVALQHRDRHALHLRIGSHTPYDALTEALDRYHEASSHTGIDSVVLHIEMMRP